MLDVRRLAPPERALTRAARSPPWRRRSGYTPSAVSQSLARLEREAGMRAARARRPPRAADPAARRPRRAAERVLAELDAAEAELAAAHGAVRGAGGDRRVPERGARLVVPAVRRSPAPPGARSCAVREHEPEDGIALLRSGELDVLVSEYYDDVEPASVGGLEAPPAAHRAAAAGAARPGASVAPVELREHCATRRWIGGLAGTQYAVAVERACRAAGLHAANRAPRRRGVAVIALAAAGLGVGAAARNRARTAPRVGATCARGPSRRAGTSPRSCAAAPPLVQHWPLATSDSTVSRRPWRSAKTSETSRSSRTSTTARRRSSTPCSGSPARSATTRTSTTA